LLSSESAECTFTTFTDRWLVIFHRIRTEGNESRLDLVV
jgi:hypothetical protein